MFLVVRNEELFQHVNVHFRKPRVDVVEVENVCAGQGFFSLPRSSPHGRLFSGRNFLKTVSKEPPFAASITACFFSSSCLCFFFVFVFGSLHGQTRWHWSHRFLHVHTGRC